MSSRLRKYLWMIVVAALVVAATIVLLWGYGVFGGGGWLSGLFGNSGNGGGPQIEEREPELMYDIPHLDYEIVEGTVGSGEPMGKIFERFGIGPSRTYKIEQACSRDSVFLRKVRAGHGYVAFMERDTTALRAMFESGAVRAGTLRDSMIPRRLAHFVYVPSRTQYVVISMPTRDSIVVRRGTKPIRLERKTAVASINSSLWGAIESNNLPVDLASQLENIYGWSVDFFGIQQGDSFEVIYDQPYVDTVKLNYIEQVWGAVFHHGGKQHFAIPFKQDGKIAYWDENGNSLKKQFLKAPLSYTRISSRFSNARLHPILRIYRPHHGIDYAAPSGTPVQSVADGVVTRRGWDNGGGGNMVWIKHARGYETGYLHLRAYGKGIVVGARVRQGQVIGEVGSTGRSTGPHLDYRLRVNGRPMDPLKIPQEPGEPIKKANYDAFSVVRAKVLGELDGTLPESERLTQLDSIAIPDGPLAPVVPSAEKGKSII